MTKTHANTTAQLEDSLHTLWNCPALVTEITVLEDKIHDADQFSKLKDTEILLVEKAGLKV